MGEGRPEPQPEFQPTPDTSEPALESEKLEEELSPEVIEKIKSDLKADLVEQPIPRTQVQETIVSSLRKSISDLFPLSPPDLLTLVKQKRPFVICFVGVNGSGKTTSIAKVAHLLKQQGLSVVLAAAAGVSSVDGRNPSLLPVEEVLRARRCTRAPAGPRSAPSRSCGRRRRASRHRARGSPTRAPWGLSRSCPRTP